MADVFIRKRAVWQAPTSTDPNSLGEWAMSQDSAGDRVHVLPIMDRLAYWVFFFFCILTGFICINDPRCCHFIWRQDYIWENGKEVKHGLNHADLPKNCLPKNLKLNHCSFLLKKIVKHFSVPSNIINQVV